MNKKYRTKFGKAITTLFLTVFLGAAVSCGSQDSADNSESIFDSMDRMIFDSSMDDKVAVADFYNVPLEEDWIGIDDESMFYKYAFDGEWFYYNSREDRGSGRELYTVTCIDRVRIKDGLEEKGYINNETDARDVMLYFMLPDGRGNCYTFWQPGVRVTEEGEIEFSDAGYSMEKYDENGELQWHRDYTNEELQGLGESLRKGTITDDGRIFLYTFGTGGKVLVFGQDGSLENICTPDVETLDGVAAGKNGKVYGYCITDRNSTFAEVEGTGEIYTCSRTPLYLYDGYENGILLCDREGMWSFEPGNGEPKQLWKWSDDYVEIIADDIRGCFLGDNNIVILMSEQRAYMFYERAEAVFASVTLEDGEDYPGKQEITLTTVNSPEDWKFSRLDLLVKWYNRHSKEYKVSIVQGKADELEMKFVKGECEDLIDLTYIYAGNLAKNGAFEDLTPYYEASETVKTDDILEPALRAGCISGKNVSVIPAFSLYTMNERETVAPENWDVWWFLEMGQENQMFTEQSPMDALMYCLGIRCGEHFIDYENNVCDFDNEEFRRILEGCSKWQKYGLYQEGLSYGTDFDKGDWLLNFVTVSSALDIMDDYDEDYAEKLIGYPGWEKPEYRLFPNSVFAMNSASENKEGAWDFLEYLMSEELQERINWGFPSRQDVFDRDLNDAYTGYLKYNTGFTDADETARLQTLADKAVEKVRQMVDSAVYDSEGERLNPVWDIVVDEAGMYFSGDATLDDTVSKIQNRVQLYLDEQ